jgi:transcription elongation factor GreA
METWPANRSGPELESGTAAGKIKSVRRGTLVPGFTLCGFFWSQTMTERIPMSREGYDRLKADLDRMQNAEMIEIAKRIAAARELGDLSENAEYHAAREDQGMLQARINALKDKLSRAYFMDKNNQAGDSVVFGARVQVKDLDLGETETFELVGPGDEDYNNNKILTSSPIAQGLIGKKRGDVAEIQVPMGKLRFEIVEISFP